MSEELKKCPTCSQRVKVDSAKSISSKEMVYIPAERQQAIDYMINKIKKENGDGQGGGWFDCSVDDLVREIEQLRENQ